MRTLTFRKLLAIAAGVSLFLFLLHLEYDDFRFKSVLYPVLWFSIPVLVLTLLPEKRSLLASIGLVAGSFVYVLLTAFFALGGIGFCAWGNHGTVYTSKTNESVKVVKRGYSCFMTDNDYTLFKERKLTEHIKLVTEFNDSPPDTTVWQKGE